MAMNLRIWQNVQLGKWQPNAWDLVAILIVFSLFALLAWSAEQMNTPYQLGKPIVINLAASQLPQYALRTVFRLLIALFFSILFTFSVGYLAAKNKHAERFIIPLIDVLQSVPILGFLSIATVSFIALFPNSLLGPECSTIFVIFTSQAWNMCLSFYQSLKMVPHNLIEAGAMLHLNKWQQLWRIEVPFAMPSLIWNTMMSLSGSWFFITFSEAIEVNNQQILLPGIGSYIETAIMRQNQAAIVYAIVTMLIVILLYDQLIFRPLVSWSEKFKMEEVPTEHKPKVFFTTLIQHTHLVQRIGGLINKLWDQWVNLSLFKLRTPSLFIPSKKSKMQKIVIRIWYASLGLLCATLFFKLSQYILTTIELSEISRVIVLGFNTSLRILILIIIASTIWVPIGVWIGLRPRVSQFVQPIAQFLAAFPANLLFPIFVILIIRYKLNVEIWTTPLMILGTQWYILFNVIAGASSLPKDLIQVTQNLGVKKWLWWWRFALPGVFPYFITGAITAAGGSWNASIAAEVVRWGATTLKAAGIGAYIQEVTAQGDFHRIALGISIMCLYVLAFNGLIWRPLYHYAEKRFQGE